MWPMMTRLRPPELQPVRSTSPACSSSRVIRRDMEISSRTLRTPTREEPVAVPPPSATHATCWSTARLGEPVDDEAAIKTQEFHSTFTNKMTIAPMEALDVVAVVDQAEAAAEEGSTAQEEVVAGAKKRIKIT